MAKNRNLHNDEFYTQLTEVEKELSHYGKNFKEKAVFCNCNDPTWSAFWRYFHLNFKALGLKKLISTCYDKECPTYKMEYEGGNDRDIEVCTKTPLEGNGDFRSPECVELLKEADIVVTNPPASLFREYVAQLMEYDKKFLMIGNTDAVMGKEFYRLLKENRVWVGCAIYKTMEFEIPDDSEFKGKVVARADGKKHCFIPAMTWYTNLELKKCNPGWFSPLHVPM